MPHWPWRAGLESRAAAEAELLHAIVRILGERERVIDADRTERRVPDDARSDRGADQHVVRVDAGERIDRGDLRSGRGEEAGTGVIPDGAGVGEDSDSQSEVL